MSDFATSAVTVVVTATAKFVCVTCIVCKRKPHTGLAVETTDRARSQTL